MSEKFKFKSKKPKEKWHIFGYTDKSLSRELIKGPHLELYGNRELIVEGCAGILDYDDTYLRLKLSKGTLIIYGGSFDIVSYEGAVISIKGCISSLEFSA